MFARFLSNIVRSAHNFGSRRVSHIFRNDASTLPQRPIETVSLPVGGNGFVDLEILHPHASTKSSSSSNSSNSNNNTTNNILVHLPAGPKPHGTKQRTSIVTSIHDLAPYFQNAMLVDIHYRLGPHNALPERDHRFPTPIHDVFTAFDYLTDPESPHNQLTAEQDRTNTGTGTGTGTGTRTAPLEPRICLYGSHIGGALALALALTKPNQILALAVEEPLADWVVLDEFATHEGAAAITRASPGLKRARSAKAKQEEYERVVAAARALVKLRTSLFRTPSGFFDSFASPMLFSRAPGRDTPTTPTAAPEESVVKENEDAEQAFGPYDDDWHAVRMSRHTDQQSDRISVAQSGSERIEQPVTDLSYWTPDDAGSERGSSLRRRKVLRRWPSITMSDEALLPYVNIFLNLSQTSASPGDSDALGLDVSPVTHTQGVELLDLLRRTCFWGREKGFAEERVTLTELSTTDLESRDRLVQWLQMRFADA